MADSIRPDPVLPGNLPAMRRPRIKDCNADAFDRSQARRINYALGDTCRLVGDADGYAD
jgi:hypothetical protein